MKFKSSNFTWYDFLQPNEEDTKFLAEEFALDPYLIKDCQQPGHLPKFEKLEHWNFLILRVYTSNDDQAVSSINELSNKIAIFYSNTVLITIHRASFDFLEKPEDTDLSLEALLLRIIYNAVNSFSRPAKIFESEIEVLERALFTRSSKKLSLEDLYFQKTETRLTKKVLLLTQGTLNQVTVAPENQTALQDVKDLLINLILEFDEALENSVALLNTYLSVNAQRTNEVMKVLTVFSAFFLPLSFVAGIYGMNFYHMPELKWHYGYFFTLTLMAGLAASIYYWFRKKDILP
jgi:magnesium transporter